LSELAVVYKITSKLVHAFVAWGGHTPLPLLAAWLAAWLNPDWIGQWAVRRRHGFLSQ